MGGDVARAVAAEDPQAGAALDRGEIIPPRLMDRRMVSEVENKLARFYDLVIDGYPRYMEQMADLVNISVSRRVILSYVVLECSHQHSFDRCRGRLRFDDHPDAIGERVRHWQQEGVRIKDWLSTRTISRGIPASVGAGMVINTETLTADEVFMTVRRWFDRTTVDYAGRGVEL